MFDKTEDRRKHMIYLVKCMKHARRNFGKESFEFNYFVREFSKLGGK